MYEFPNITIALRMIIKLFDKKATPEGVVIKTNGITAARRNSNVMIICNASRVLLFSITNITLEPKLKVSMDSLNVP